LFWTVVSPRAIVVTVAGIAVNDEERALVFHGVRFAFNCPRVV
jgi:hypothetical protein